MAKKLLQVAMRLLIVIIIGALLGSLLGTTVVWDGGFSQVEFQVRFLDQELNPVKGIMLSVTDSRGTVAFGYPVTDYREDWIPTSNEDGLMVFHHVNLSPEFGGKYRNLFFFIPVGEYEAPKYILHFLSSGKEVARYDYNNYLGEGIPDWSTLPTVKREWLDIGKSPQSLPERLRPECRSTPSVLEYHVLCKTLIISP